MFALKKVFGDIGPTLELKLKKWRDEIKKRFTYDSPTFFELNLEIDSLIRKNPGHENIRDGELMIQAYRQAFKSEQRKNLELRAEIEQLEKQLEKKKTAPKRKATVHNFGIIDGGKKFEERPPFAPQPQA
jgi:hypothetical protein